MAAIPPELLVVGRRQLTILGRVMGAARPAEGCALLLGTTGVSWQLELVWPCLNAWPQPDERTRRFALDPREQLLAQRCARQRGLQVLGCAHSHPSSASMPSALDRELTLAPALLLIAGSLGLGGDLQTVQSADGWHWASWWLPEAPLEGCSSEAMPVPWRMVDD